MRGEQKGRLGEAQEAEALEDWVRAKGLYERLAREADKMRNCHLASEFYMRAALAGEKAQDWRDIGFLWIRCARSLEGLQTKEEAVETPDAARHFFPTISPDHWLTLEALERKGRAYRNAAYHLEKAGPNQSAYIQYRQSGSAFEEARLWDEASRSYYYANLNYIDQHGVIDEDLLRALERVNSELLKQDRGRYLRRLQVHYRILHSALMKHRNVEDGDCLFVKELDVTRNLQLQQQRLFQWSGYTLWRWASLYGTSFWRWLMWAGALVVVIFPVLYWKLSLIANNSKLAWHDYVYFSFQTFVPLGEHLLIPTAWGRLVVAAEASSGILMLGLLVAMFVRKFVR